MWSFICRFRIKDKIKSIRKFSKNVYNNPNLLSINKYNKQQGSELIYNILEERGVSHVFGFSGEAILPLTDRFHSKWGGSIKYIMNRTEQCAGHAATGYAKSSNNIGILITTSGSGLTNVVTPIQDAMSDGVPLIVLSGQVQKNSIGTQAFQECPAVDITRPCTKWSYQIRDIFELPLILHKAFYIASVCDLPGPVHIDLPKDILLDTFDSFTLKSMVYNIPESYLQTINEVQKNKLNWLIKDSDKINPAVEKQYFKKDIRKLSNYIHTCKKPILLVGKGGNHCSSEITYLANKYNIPVTTTLHGLGCYNENYTKSLHLLGTHGSAYANFAIQKADLIIGVGVRFDDRITGKPHTFAPEANLAMVEKRGGIVHINIDNKKTYKSIKSIIEFKLDSKLVLNELINDLDNISLRSNLNRNFRDDWLEEISQLKSDYPLSYIPNLKDNSIKIQQVIEQIGFEADLPNTIFTTGVGNHQMMAAQFIRWVRPNSMITSGSLGVMGTGIPYSIGVQIANPDKQVIVIDGDGSFNMTMQDLATIVEYNLPIKIFIMNDSRKQMIYVWQKLFFDGRIISTENKNPDYVALGKSFGIHSMLCSEASELENKIKKAIEFDGPVLVECRVLPDICLPLVEPGKALDEMILPGENIFSKSVVNSFTRDSKAKDCKSTTCLGFERIDQEYFNGISAPN